MPKLVSIKKDPGVHKFVAHFVTDEGRDKHIRFGLKGYEHFTNGGGYVGHLDEERRRRYVNRHKGEDWENPMTAGALSYWILWKVRDFDSAVREFRHHFSL